MSALSKRLYIGNVSVRTSDSDLRKVMSQFGTVSSIELKTKANISESSSSKTFAYADIVFDSESKLRQCLEKDHKLDGCDVRIQVAKEHFLKRLQRERDGVDTSSDQSNAQYKSHHSHHLPVKAQLPPETHKRYNDDNVAAKKTMFQRLESISTPVQEKQDEVPAESVTKTKQQMDDERRVKSLMALQAEKEKQSQLIRESLKNPNRNRIVFDSGEYSSPVANGSNSSQPKTPLFQEDDEDVADLTLDQSVKRSAKKGNQLIEMQSQFAHDSRFQVNQTFLDDDDEDGDEAEGNDEKAHNMEILESVFHKPFLPSDAKPVKQILVPRYDPLSVASHKYEIKRKAEAEEHDNEQPTSKKHKKQQQQKDASKEKKGKGKQTIAKHQTKVTGKVPIETSKERFYAVSSSLMEAFAKRDEEKESASTFRVSSLLGSGSQEDEDGKASQRSDALWNIAAKKKQKETAVPHTLATEKPVSVITKERDLFTEPFFLSKHDPRLKEDPFFDPKAIKRLKKVLKTKLVKGMDVTLAKKNKAAKNKKAGRVFQKFTRVTEAGVEYEEKVMKNKKQFTKRKFKPKVTNKLSARQERLQKERQERKNDPNKKNDVNITGKNRGKAFFASKKAKI